MNYDELVSDLQTYMLRTDEPYVDKIPDFIQQGIIRIYNNAKDIGFEMYLNQPGGLNVGQSTLNKPNGWKNTISFSIIDASNKVTFLQERTFEYCNNFIDNLGQTGVPKYYYDQPPVNSNSNGAYDAWGISPAPNAIYSINIVYLALPNFNENNQVNFITIRYPNLLLYSCLIEACLFLDNEEKRGKYEDMFSKELATINAMNIERFSDRVATRDRS